MKNENNFVQCYRNILSEFNELDYDISLTINNAIDELFVPGSQGKHSNPVTGPTNRYDPFCFSTAPEHIPEGVHTEEPIMSYSNRQPREKKIQPWLRYNSKKDVYKSRR